jgi:hypothetical protein
MDFLDCRHFSPKEDPKRRSNPLGRIDFAVEQTEGRQRDHEKADEKDEQDQVNKSVLCLPRCHEPPPRNSSCRPKNKKAELPASFGNPAFPPLRDPWFSAPSLRKVRLFGIAFL